MKKLLLILITAISLQSYSQIQMKETPKEIVVGEVRAVGTLRAKLTYEIIKDDTVYTLLYRNAEYEHIVDFAAISFSDTEGALNSFYNILVSAFSDENKKKKDFEVEFKLGDTDVYVSSIRVMGTTSVRIWTRDGYAYFTESQVNKVFGKSK